MKLKFFCLFFFENVGCVDHPLYVRFTQSLAWFDHSNLEEDVQHTQGLPYFPTLASDSMRVLLGASEDLGLEEHFVSDHCTFFSCVGVIGSVLKGIVAYKMQRVMREKWDAFISLSEENEEKEKDKNEKKIANAASGISEVEEEEEEKTEVDNNNNNNTTTNTTTSQQQPPRSPQHMPSKEGEVVFGNGLTLMKLMDALGNTEKGLRARMVSEKPLPKHILLFLKEFLWAEEAIIFHYLNEASLAMKVIKYFILSLKGFKNVLNCATILEVPMGMVMEVLHNTTLPHFPPLPPHYTSPHYTTSKTASINQTTHHHITQHHTTLTTCFT